MGIAKLESFLEDRIEGFFNRKFASSLEPVELCKGLEREATRQARKIDGEKILPDEYTFLLSEEDYQRLCAKRILDELYEVAEKLVIKKNCFMDGKLKIELKKNHDLSKGMLKVTAAFGGEDKPEPEEATEAKSDTLVLQKPNLNTAPTQPPKRSLATLQVVEGEDKEASLVLGEQPVYIGRREKSDFIITDTNVSRTHAYIAYERHRHLLSDAGSLNGTWINGRRLATHCLQVGDRIGIGSSILVYGVI